MIKLPFPDSLITEYPGGARRHQGIDYAVPVGTPVRSAIDGTVVFAANDGSGSLTIDVLRDDGLLVRAGHNSKFMVGVGARVRVGDVIALSGNTGWSTGPHSHIEFRWDRLWNGGSWLNWDQIQALIRSENASNIPQVDSGDSEMKMIHRKKNGVVQYAMFGPGFWFVFTGEAAASRFLGQGGGGSSWPATDSFWAACKTAATKGVYDHS